MRALDVEYRHEGVRCNAIAPGVLDTPANRRAQVDADHDSWTDPVEIARVIRFLVSDDFAVVTGATLPVYGRSSLPGLWRRGGAPLAVGAGRHRRGGAAVSGTRYA